MEKEKKAVIERTVEKFMKLKDEFHKGYVAGYMTFVMAEKEKQTEKQTA